MANQMIGESDSIRVFSPFLQLEQTSLESTILIQIDSFGGVDYERNRKEKR